jgi:hypothetical protein
MMTEGAPLSSASFAATCCDLGLRPLRLPPGLPPSGLALAAAAGGPASSCCHCSPQMS